jgi:hypothetical protein
MFSAYRMKGEKREGRKEGRGCTWERMGRRGGRGWEGGEGGEWMREEGEGK